MLFEYLFFREFLSTIWVLAEPIAYDDGWRRAVQLSLIGEWAWAVFAALGADGHACRLFRLKRLDEGDLGDFPQVCCDCRRARS